MKIRSRAVLGSQSRFGDAPGRARDGPGRPKSRAKADLGAAGAGQERPGTAQNPPWTGPETAPGSSKSLRDNSQDARNAVRVAKRSWKRLRIDCRSIFGRCAEAPK